MREEKRFPDLCDYCEIFNPNQELIDLLKEDILAEDVVYDLAELFKTMGDPTRIKILYALKDRELCVCDCRNCWG